MNSKQRRQDKKRRIKLANTFIAFAEEMVRDIESGVLSVGELKGHLAEIRQALREEATHG